MAIFTGTAAADTLNGSSKADEIYGLAGADSLVGGAGNDTIDAGDEDNAADTVLGGAGADLIATWGGADVIDGGTQSDTIDAGDGNDSVKGGSHNDSILGGAGADTLDGGSHDDTIDAGSGADSVLGGSGDDEIYGRGGADAIDGGSGDDSAEGGAGDDTLVGASGNDSLAGGGDNDSISGDSGSDLLEGDAGDDTLTGATGNDEILGGDDNDDITGGSGDDTLDGGAGDDTFRFDADSDSDTVNNFEADKDILCFEGLDPADMTITQVDTDTVISFVDGPVVTLTDVALALEPTFTTKFSQDYEANIDGWFDSDDFPGSYGLAERVASGTGGIASAEGGFHGMFSETDGGPFTRFDGYRDTFPGTWKASSEIYLDVNWAAGSGFDFSVASNGSDGAHQRDFIFHVTKDTSTGDLLVGASNNSSFAPREDLESLTNNADIDASGWYTFEHVFYDDGGVLAVDLNVYDAADSLLFTETLSDPSDTIPAEVGGNRYGWFTAIDVAGGLAVDNTTLMIQDGPLGADWLCFA